jgi:kynureninase
MDDRLEKHMKTKTLPYRADAAFAREMDEADPLAAYRRKFHFPKGKNGMESIYLCGNSLGLEPVDVKPAMIQALDDWAAFGIEGYWNAEIPWISYNERLMKAAEHIAGAKPGEAAVMNTLTINLNLMMVSFYRPTARRHKILIENNAFPSDRYAVDAQIRYHGFDPRQSLLELKPREGEVTLRAGDILQTIEKEGDSIALIMIGGVNYYTGQFFDLEAITRAGHAKGCVVGFDLAHAAGNVPLKLHDWNVDFACWCSYKYLNGGPAALGGCFVHERHGNDPALPRFAGWWGHDKETRFKMGPDFQPIQGVEGWQMSNTPIFSLVPVKVSLDMFLEAGMDRLREKSLKLTGYLEFLLNGLGTDAFKFITPSDPAQRGAQMSIVVKKDGRKVFDALKDAGVICDWREPDCIRIAPAPIYNNFSDVYRFAEIFARELGLGLENQVQPRISGTA